jgi:hypothetical protein
VPSSQIGSDLLYGTDIGRVPGKNPAADRDTVAGNG